MSKFKIGDKVRRTGINTMNLRNGWIYRVRRVAEYGDSLFVDDFETPYSEEGFELVEEDTSKHHKHHDLIVAWAKGAKIQFKYSGSEVWRDVETPQWMPIYQYRIKPEPKPDYTLVGQVVLYDDQKKLHMQHSGKFAQVGVSGHVKDCHCVFDGETGQLKSVELIK